MRHPKQRLLDRTGALLVILMTRPKDDTSPSHPSSPSALLQAAPSGSSSGPDKPGPRTLGTDARARFAQKTRIAVSAESQNLSDGGIVSAQADISSHSGSCAALNDDSVPDWWRPSPAAFSSSAPAPAPCASSLSGEAPASVGDAAAPSAADSAACVMVAHAPPSAKLKAVRRQLGSAEYWLDSTLDDASLEYRLRAAAMVLHGGPLHKYRDQGTGSARRCFVRAVPLTSAATLETAPGSAASIKTAPGSSSSTDARDVAMALRWASTRRRCSLAPLRSTEAAARRIVRLDPFVYTAGCWKGGERRSPSPLDFQAVLWKRMVFLHASSEHELQQWCSGCNALATGSAVPLPSHAPALGVARSRIVRRARAMMARHGGVEGWIAVQDHGSSCALLWRPATDERRWVRSTGAARDSRGASCQSTGSSDASDRGSTKAAGSSARSTMRGGRDRDVSADVLLSLPAVLSGPRVSAMPSAAEPSNSNSLLSRRGSSKRGSEDTRSSKRSRGSARWSVELTAFASRLERLSTRLIRSRRRYNADL